MNHEDQRMECHLAELDPQAVRRLNDEIRYLRARLRQIGYEGDSAYERALHRVYEIGLESRLLRLAQGRGTRTGEAS